MDARIWLGIHFRAADVDARKLGERVAGWAFSNFLRPIGHDHDHDHDDCDR